MSLSINFVFFLFCVVCFVLFCLVCLFFVFFLFLLFFRGWGGGVVIFVLFLFVLPGSYNYNYLLQSVPITTKVVSSNPTQAGFTRFNVM